MKVLCVTQGQGLKLFDALAKKLDDGGNSTAFIVTDSAHYKQKWLKKHPDFENRHTVLKEWDITSKRNSPIDHALLDRYEKELGGPGIWGALHADRRIVMGPYCTVQQDYRRRFTDSELTSILQECLVRVDALLTDFKPDVIISFICVTPIEYLVSLFARARGIRYINLRPSRVTNNFQLVSTTMDPSPELVASYRKLLSGENQYTQKALDHIANVQSRKVKYEGAIRATSKPMVVQLGLITRLKQMAYAFYTLLTQRDPDVLNDNAIANPVPSEFIRNFVVPYRAAKLARMMKDTYIYPEDMEGKSFAFFPLHTEPEIQLLVYSRPYGNQIEAIRAAAMALPAGMSLVVKEHPWMIGKRKLGYYKKLLEIPKVLISAPEIDTSHYVDKAALIVTLGSSVGQDATMFGKPVITLGNCIYNILPRTMVRQVLDYSLLPWEIRDLLANYQYNEKAMCAFIGGVLDHGIGINFYSVLLSKAGMNTVQNTQFDDDVGLLAARIKSLLQTQPHNAELIEGSARW